jgi:hypothetical protein
MIREHERVGFYFTAFPLIAACPVFAWLHTSWREAESLAGAFFAFSGLFFLYSRAYGKTDATPHAGDVREQNQRRMAHVLCFEVGVVFMSSVPFFLLRYFFHW